MKTEVITIHPKFPEKDSIARCAKIIRQGGLVIFPTETVYGIAADASNPYALERLREVKRRLTNKPFTIMIAQKDEAAQKTSCRDTRVFKLIDRYWPGPLTLILPALTQGETIGLRMPSHTVALALVQESGCPIAAPSANFENNPAPRTCVEALRDLDGLIDVALDAGPASIGIASTIIDFTASNPRMIRKGQIVQKDIDDVVDKKTILMVCTGNSCRSVMAEYLLRDKLKGRNDFEIISAGTNVFITAGASSGAVRLLNKKGIDAGNHLSQPVTKILLYKSDLILVMTQQHRDMVIQFLPEAAKRVFLLGEFIPADKREGLDIMDPVGQDDAVYERCGRVIDEALDNLVKIL